MRERLARAVPAATVLDGTAEAIPVPDGSVDAVFVAEAMHWFAIELAAAEIARILVPGGALVVLRNVPTWSEDTTAWLRELRALLDPVRRAAPGYPAAGDDWRTRLEATRRFTPFEAEAATHEQTLEAEAFVAQAASWSWVATLPGEERQALLDRVRALAERHAPIVVPYRTEAFRARRRA
jgi:ubiquinone/menaquinone biosynthesis C-methylase UbiE